MMFLKILLFIQTVCAPFLGYTIWEDTGSWVLAVSVVVLVLSANGIFYSLYVLYKHNERLCDKIEKMLIEQAIFDIKIGEAAKKIIKKEKKFNREQSIRNRNTAVRKKDQ